MGTQIDDGVREDIRGAGHGAAHRPGEEEDREELEEGLEVHFDGLLPVAGESFLSLRDLPSLVPNDSFPSFHFTVNLIPYR